MMMRLLVKPINSGVVAHIADTEGKPLCFAKLKLSQWQLQERSATDLIVCYHCKRLQAKASG
jgi:hypothetical protein